MAQRTVLVIPHYHKRRRANVHLILEGIGSWSQRPDEIIIVNNSGKALHPKGAVEVVCGKNFGSGIRYAVAVMNDAEVCVFQDDDIKLGTNTFRDLVSAVTKNPDSVIGVVGVNVPENSYLTRKTVHHGECDVVVGRVSACKRNLLWKCFKAMSELDWQLLVGDALTMRVNNHEDIPLSLENRRQGNKNYIIESECSDLDVFGDGLCESNQHYYIRDLITRRLA